MQISTRLLITVLLFSLGYSVAQSAVPSVEQNAFISQGDKDISAGNLDEALKSFKKAAAIQAEIEIVQQKLANVYLLKGEYRSSIQHFHKTLGFNGKNSKAFIGLSLAYLHSGDYSLAKAALEEARQYSDEMTITDIDKLIEWIKLRQKD